MKAGGRQEALLGREGACTAAERGSDGSCLASNCASGLGGTDRMHPCTLIPKSKNVVAHEACAHLWSVEPHEGLPYQTAS